MRCVWTASFLILLAAGPDPLAQDLKPAARKSEKQGDKPAKNGKFSGLLSTLRLGHPRIYITPENFPALRTLPGIRANADRMMNEPLTKYAGDNLEYRNHSGRRIYDFAQTMGLAYLLTGEKKYADRGIEELKVGVGFPEWGRHGGKTSDLYTSEMCQAFGIGYDWLYGAMSEEDRKIVREALVTKGLNITLDLYKKNTYWVVETENWNPTCNRGAAIGALAIAEEEPSLAEAILDYSLKSISHGLDGFGADGGYTQGGYVFAAAESAVRYLAAIRSALGVVPGLDKYPGFAKCGLFPIYLTGPTGRWYNYYDAHDLPTGGVPWMFWMADTFKQPVYAHFAQQRQGDDFFTRLWRSPAQQPQNPLQAGLPPDRLFKDVDVAILRTAWEDPNAIWIGFKGGDTTTGHSHLDMGSFVMDALGQRWAVDPGMGDYLWPSYWDAGGGKRWKYYRTNTLGHNTLVLDGQNQKYGPKAPVAAFHGEEGGGSAVVDLTAVYPQTSSCLRGIRVLQRQRVLVQDELRARAPVEVVWGMHTRAKVEVNGNQATLASGGKVLQARILAPENARFDMVAADDAINTPRNISLGSFKPGVSKLLVRLPDKVQDLTLRVLLCPGGDASEADLPKAEPLKSWKGWP